jgi:hypothetical protein
MTTRLGRCPPRREQLRSSISAYLRVGSKLGVQIGLLWLLSLLQPTSETT